MNRLVVNPGTPQAWEIQLKQGINSIGRGATNDFQIHDPSVSGSHCEIIVNGASITIKDLGSTNGTFIDQSKIQEASFRDGQALRLGTVELALQSSVPEAVLIGAVPSARIVAPAGPVAPPPLPAPPTVGSLRPAGLRRVELATTPAAAPADDTADSAPFATEVLSAPKFCKFHPKSAARYFCRKCNRGFCELCVVSRAEKKMCRACGVECTPLKVQSLHAGSKGFFARLPGAIVYPFRGMGILILIVSTLIFAGLGMMGGLFSLLIKMAAIGYLFSYMQNIIFSTAAEDNEMPDLPGMDGLFSAFFTLAGTVLMSFGLAIGLAVARFMFDVEAIPTSAIVVAVIFGCLYFPMAFLAAAMKDTALAANPLVVIPGILKVPLEYMVAVILMGGIFGIQKLGDLVAGGAKQSIFTTRHISTVLIAMGFAAIWSFISVYLMTVNMRILGLLYVAKKDKLQWF